MLIEAAERHWLFRKYITPYEVDQIVPTGVLDGPGPEYLKKMRESIEPEGGKEPTAPKPNETKDANDTNDSTPEGVQP